MKHFKLIWTLALLIAVSTNLNAGPVTQEQALQKAREFMTGRIFKEPKLRLETGTETKTEKGENPYYVFNAAGDNGFVIVSGDDRTEAILGYADQGNIDMTNLPDNLKNWLEGYAEQIEALGDMVLTDAGQSTSWAAVAPFVTCHWNQTAPFNLKCPEYSSGRYCVTGCVATAMAQVMYYYRWPSAPLNEIAAYKSTYNGYTFYLDALPVVNFQWNKMRDDYSSNETGEAAQAVAELMQYCGQAVQMKYSPNSSGAIVYASDLINMFGYSNSAKDVNRADYTTLEWEEMIYAEVAAQRPVLYGGSSSSGGHQFVCDGYDGNGKFHINWGWGGSSDGFFVLSVLNPYFKGTGGGTARDGYTNLQDAIIGIQPAASSETPSNTPTLHVNQVTISSGANATRSSVSSNFSVGIKSRTYTWDANGYVDHAWALTKDGEQLAIIGKKSNTLMQTSYMNFSSTLSFGAGLADGEYIIYDVYSPVGENDWRKANGAGEYYYVATIHGNSLTLTTSSSLSGDVVLNDVTIEGDNMRGRPMNITMSLTNEGHTYSQTFYLWESSSNVAQITTYIDHGLTGEGTFSITPSSAGTYTYRITSDENGSNVLWSQQLTIAQFTYNTLAATFTIDGIRNGAIESTTLNATVAVKNERSTTFNEKVYILLYPTYNKDAAIQQVRQMTIAANGTETTQVEFTDLEAGKEYTIELQYYNTNKLESAGTSTCRVGYTFVVSQLTGTIIVTNGTSDNKVYGTTMKADVTLTNTGSNAYNDRIEVRPLYSQGGSLWYSYGSAKEYNLQLAAGETKTISVEVGGLVIGREYLLRINYYSENNSNRAVQSDLYLLEEEPEVQTVTGSIGTKQSGVWYDLNSNSTDAEGLELHVSTDNPNTTGATTTISANINNMFADNQIVFTADDTSLGDFSDQTTTLQLTYPQEGKNATFSASSNQAGSQTYDHSWAVWGNSGAKYLLTVNDTQDAIVAVGQWNGSGYDALSSTVNIVTLNKENGVINYVSNDTSKDILNYANHSNMQSLATFAAYVEAEVDLGDIRYTAEVSNAYMNVRFLRPMTLMGKYTQTIIDDSSEPQEINMTSFFMMMNYLNQWPSATYNLYAPRIKYSLANARTDKDAPQDALQYNDLEGIGALSLLSDVTDKIHLTAKSSETVTYNYQSSLSVYGNSITYQNDEPSTVDFHIYIPLTLSYVWGTETQPMYAVLTVKKSETAVVNGDANNDGEVDVVDITAIANHILGQSIADFNATAADADGDTEIDVNDIVTIANIILYSGVPSGAKLMGDASVNNDYLTLMQQRDGSLTLDLVNQHDYSSFQLDVRVTDGASIDDVVLNSLRKSGHAVSYARISDNTYRILAYAIDNESLQGNNGTLLTLSGTGLNANDITLENITFSNSRQQKSSLTWMRGDATSIRTQSTTTNSPADIYSINGQLIRKNATTTDGLQPGVYVINGKKTFIN